MAIDPSNASRLFVAGLAGAFRSTDGGVQWSKVFGLECGTIAVHPTDGSIVFLTDRKRQVYKSTDGGQTFVLSSGGIAAVSQGFIFGRIAFQPGNPSTMYSAWPKGLFKSTDGGTNWVASDAGPVFNQSVGDFAVDSTNAQVLYLALSFKGVFKSIDAGVTWVASSAGLPFSGTTINVQAFAQDPLRPQTLYVIGRDYKLYASTDGATSWAARSATAPAFSTLRVAPGDGQTLYAGGVESSTSLLQIFKSTDGGVNWTVVSSSVPRGFSKAAPLSIPAASPLTVYASLGNGLSKTVDGGATWVPINTGLRGEEADYPIGFSPSSPSTWYLEYQQSGIYKTVDGGASMSPANGSLVYAGIGAIVVDPTNPQVLLAAGSTQAQAQDPNNFTSYLVRTTDGGTTWSPVANPLFPSGYTSLQPWGFVAVPTTPTTYFAMSAGEGVYKSTDGGLTFARLDTGLPPLTPTIFYNSIAAADSSGTTLYVATGSGLFKTSNGGGTWAPTGTGLPTGSVRTVIVGASAPQRVFSISNGTVYRSTDSGVTWNRVTAAFPGSATTMAMDPNAPATVYATGTSLTGQTRTVWIYRSIDGGTTWNPVTSQGLDISAAFTLAVDPANSNHLLIGGRGGISEITLAPTITDINPNGGPAAGGQSVTVTGTNLIGASLTIGGNSPIVSTTDTTVTFITPAHTAGAVDVTVTTPAGTATSVGGFTYGATVPSAPVGVNADATSAPSVLVSWNTVGTADSYQVFRSSGGGFAQITAVAGPPFTDLTVSAGQAYLYKVRAVASGIVSGDSNIDLTTTVIFTDDPLLPQTTVVKGIHLTEMRTAVNALRTLAGIGSATWIDPSLTAVTIKAIHITELRTALDAARSGLLLSPLSYMNNPLTIGTSLVAGVDFMEIRNGTK